MGPNTSQPSRKKPVNLTVNEELLKAARDHGINLSATLESSLRDRLKQTQRQQWMERNRDAIARYNGLVEQQGVFSDDDRTF